MIGMEISGRTLLWKLRRIAAGLRQQDVASRVGVSVTRYSAIERGEREPSELDARLIERALPAIPMILSGSGAVDT
jgi:transcriptional regulator with XRE-family HTH domain